MSPALRVFRRPAAALALMSAAVLVTACSASSPTAPSPQPSSSSAGSTTPPASPPPASTAPVSTAPATTPPAAQGRPSCATRSLQVKLGLSQGTAGSTYQTIVFTNISSASCTLYGYPGVSLAGGSPISQIGLAANRNPQAPPKLVVLDPTAQASALLRVVTAQNYPQSRCGLKQATYLQVYPPNQTTPVYVAYHAGACTKSVPLLTIDSVKHGSGG